MLKETNIEKVKEMAHLFNQMDIEKTDYFPFVIHPFISNLMYPKDNTGKNWYNIENEDDLKCVRKKIDEQIDRINDYSYFQIIVSKAYCSAFFKYTYKYLSLEDFSKALINLFTCLEYANDDKNISLYRFVQLFKKADIKYMVEPSDIETYNNLPDEVTIYRGVKPKANVKALSWSLDKKVACWFADRFEKNGKVYKGKIKKEDILVYTNARNEKEVIVDYRKLYDVKEIKRWFK